MSKVRQKPEGPITLNRAHPLVRKLVCAVPFNEGRGGPRDLVTGLKLSLTSGGSWGAGPYGREAIFTTTNRWSAALPASMQIQAPLTVMAVVNYFGTTAENRVPFGAMANSTFGSPYNSWAIWQNNGSGNNIGLGYNNGAFAQTVFTITAGVTTVIICTLTATASQVFFNGVSQGTGGGSAAIQYDATATLNMGTCPGGSHSSFRVSLGMCWNRLLTKKEICSLSNDPFQVFRPLKKTVLPQLPATSQGNFLAFMAA